MKAITIRMNDLEYDLVRVASNLAPRQSINMFIVDIGIKEATRKIKETRSANQERGTIIS